MRRTGTWWHMDGGRAASRHGFSLTRDNRLMPLISLDVEHHDVGEPFVGSLVAATEDNKAPRVAETRCVAEARRRRSRSREPAPATA